MRRPQSSKRARSLREKCAHRRHISGRKAAWLRSQLRDLFTAEDVQEFQELSATLQAERIAVPNLEQANAAGGGA